MGGQGRVGIIIGDWEIEVRGEFGGSREELGAILRW